MSAATKNLGDKVEIRIRDNGTGIPREVKEKMFNPFFTTKPAGEGTGLGLSMSHDIVVKQHGGKIDPELEAVLLLGALAYGVPCGAALGLVIWSVWFLVVRRAGARRAATIPSIPVVRTAAAVPETLMK